MEEKMLIFEMRDIVKVYFDGIKVFLWGYCLGL